MKRIVYLFFLLVGLCTTAVAQHAGIAFEHGLNWEQLKQKAVKEHKLIFLDCYTTWCVPCKMMANEVFTQDSVGAYFNRNFISAQLDMEHDSNSASVKVQYGITAYPTLLFVNPETGEMVHKLVGSGSSAWLLKEAAVAQHPESSLAGLERKFKDGERSEAFLEKYIKAQLSTASSREGQQATVLTFLDNLTDSELVMPLTVALIRSFVSDPLSRPFRVLMEKRKAFYAVAGQGPVDNLLENTLRVKVLTGLRSSPGPGHEANDRYREALFDFIKQNDFFDSPTLLGFMYLARAEKEKDFTGLLTIFRDGFAYNLFHSAEDYLFLELYKDAFAGCKDINVLKEMIALLDQHSHDLTDKNGINCLNAIRNRISSILPS